jgi:hypothetical protein
MLNYSSCAFRIQKYEDSLKAAENCVQASQETLAKALYCKSRALELLGQRSNFPSTVLITDSAKVARTKAFKVKTIGKLKNEAREISKHTALVAAYSALVGCSQSIGAYLRNNRETLNDGTVYDLELYLA